MKRASSRADLVGMETFGVETWLVLAGLFAAGALSMVYPAALMVRNEIDAHELQARVAKLRADQIKRLKELADLTMDATVVGEA